MGWNVPPGLKRPTAKAVVDRTVDQTERPSRDQGASGVEIHTRTSLVDCDTRQSERVRYTQESGVVRDEGYRSPIGIECPAASYVEVIGKAGRPRRRIKGAAIQRESIIEAQRARASVESATGLIISVIEAYCSSPSAEAASSLSINVVE